MQIERIHFYVENAQAWRDWFVQQLGFGAIASGSDGEQSWQVVQSGAICFVIAAPQRAGGRVGQYLDRHPPGVAEMTWQVEDVEAVLQRAIVQGAEILQPLHTEGSQQWAQISGWGSLRHTLVSGSTLKPLPGGLFQRIDHVVLNVAQGELERAAAWYQGIFKLESRQSFAIATEYSGLFSRVLVTADQQVQLPINEPTSASSQIQEFLNWNGGPGVQHIALQTNQIVEAISRCRQRGVSFLSVPPSYYEQLAKRATGIVSPQEWEAIVQQEILVDWNEAAPASLLLQTFTQPIFRQPTFFFEMIERRQCAQGFGEGNFRALFEAIEREQRKRGQFLANPTGVSSGE